ncbi:MAG: B12-binding domain-containing radical SAM protein [Planctomycetota bacterium]
MELPRRLGDELLEPGDLLRLRGRLRNLAASHDLTTVIACAFDHRTRMLPFIGADRRMAPAGVRALGAEMAAAGFGRTRVVLQQWNRRFCPSEARLDGRLPDILMVSSMSLHAAPCRALIADATRIDEPHRPLIVVGGPKSVYRPWTDFRVHPGEPPGPDVAVTGEVYVWLSLLEVLLAERAHGEPLRRVFSRARDRGLLDAVPGLVYPHVDRGGVAEELVDTGVQRLVGDLDEMAHPSLGYRLLEAPSRARTLAARPLPVHRVRRHSPISSLVLTFGCKFRCNYCPIPAYNQRQHRLKSPERIVEEFRSLYEEFGFRLFFGTDDNFFNDHDRAVRIADALARVTVDGGRPIRKRVRWATEATIHDTLQLKDHLPLFRRSGMRALWMGVEDMTATLVKKGQSVRRTTEAFTLLRQHGIHPMPMMMHHDEQPLYTRGSPYGLLNQVQILRDSGAVTLQVLMLVPATGSKLYEETYTSGLAFESVNGRPIRMYQTDGNYIIASRAEKPWRKQINLLAAYLFFYNPLRLPKAIVFPKSKLYLADVLGQLFGMWGLVHTMRRTIPWAWHLWRGERRRCTNPPVSRIPIRAPSGGRAGHALESQDAASRSARRAAAVDLDTVS